MKLEVGKSYKNRRGEKVVIVSKDDDDDNSFIATEGERYNENGRYWFSQPTEWDLISEWEEPEQHTICGTYLFVRALRAFEGMTDTERKAALAYLNERWGKR